MVSAFSTRWLLVKMWPLISRTIPVATMFAPDGLTPGPISSGSETAICTTEGRTTE